MLVLKRFEGERIMIESGVEITVLKIRGIHVSIGVKADREIRIVRGELAATVIDSGNRSKWT